ncbi:pentatricopeptide repeat-containing protein At2g35030, mitochondrial-like, partial [Selaginella moellendorffii]
MILHTQDEWLRRIEACKSLSLARAIEHGVRRAVAIKHGGDESSSSIFILNKLIEMFGKCGSPQLAREVFDRLDTAMRDSFSWDFMLTAYSRNGQLENAKLLFDSMPQRSLVSWNIMLSTYAQCGHLDSAKIIFDSTPIVSIVSWNAILTAFIGHGLLLEATQIFDSMPEKNLVSWTAMLAAYAQKGHIFSAKEIFDAMPLRDMIAETAMLA